MSLVITFGNNCFSQKFAYSFISFPAKYHFCLFVPIGDTAERIDGNDSIQGSIQNQTRTKFTFTKRFLRTLSIGNVKQHAMKEFRFAGRIADYNCIITEPDMISILITKSIFAMQRIAAFSATVFLFQNSMPIFSMNIFNPQTGIIN